MDGGWKTKSTSSSFLTGRLASCCSCCGDRYSPAGNKKQSPEHISITEMTKTETQIKAM